MRRGFAILLLAGGTALADAPDAEDTRYHALIQEVRCLVCQNQSIAESNAPLAADLRAQIRQQIAAGRSDEEIIRYLTDRYGDFVRYRPAFAARTWLLWLGPFALLGVGALTVARLARRSRTASAAHPDPAAVRKILKEEEPR